MAANKAKDRLFSAMLPVAFDQTERMEMRGSLQAVLTGNEVDSGGNPRYVCLISTLWGHRYLWRVEKTIKVLR